MNRFSAMLGLLALALLAPARAELPQYVMRDLGTFGYAGVKPWAINSYGYVAGQVYVEGTTSRAFFWDGVLHELGPGIAYDVNDQGTVAAGDRIWSGGITTSTDNYTALTISNSGLVAGISNAEAAVIGPEGQVRSLGTLGGAWSTVAAVNDGGAIVGSSPVQSPVFPDLVHAFIWADEVLQDLGTIGGASAANDINNAGTVVGTSRRDSMSPTWAVRWLGIGQVEPLWVGVATAINDKGWVVGQKDGRYPVIWADGQLLSLPLGMFHDGAAMDINASGVVVGFAGSHAVIWEPVPEPGSLAVLLAGVGWGGVLALRRLRTPDATPSD